jgi:hypothetical protein
MVGFSERRDTRISSGPLFRNLLGSWLSAGVAPLSPMEPLPYSLQIDLPKVNRPGMSGDSDRWEGWSHARRDAQAVPA